MLVAQILVGFVLVLDVVADAGRVVDVLAGQTCYLDEVVAVVVFSKSGLLFLLFFFRPPLFPSLSRNCLLG